MGLGCGCGAAGARGSLWYFGAGVPGTIAGQLNGDLYLNTTTDDLYQLVGGVWTLETNIKGAAGSPGAVGPVMPTVIANGQTLTITNSPWPQQGLYRVPIQTQPGGLITVQPGSVLVGVS